MSPLLFSLVVAVASRVTITRNETHRDSEVERQKGEIGYG
jgi:hypothetical protein